MSKLPYAITPEDMLNMEKLQHTEIKDKYVSLYQDFLTLKKFTKSQEDKIRRLQTKLQKLTHDTFRSSRAEFGSMKGLRLKYEGEIEELKNTISLMSSRIEILQGKLKVASVQLGIAKERKRPSFYRHIPPRVDSGLKRSSFVSRSLTNVTSDLRKIGHAKEKSKSSLDLSSERGHLMDIQTNIGLSSQDTELDENINGNDQKRLLDASQKKIRELELAHEQLLHQVIEDQQMAGEREETLRKKVADFQREYEEKELNARKSSSSISHKSDVIRFNEEEVKTNARVAVLMEHISQLEEQLREESRCKESALEDLEKLKLDLNKKDSFLRENTLAVDKVQEEIRELKALNNHLKEQTNLLEDQNRKLSKFQHHLSSGLTKENTGDSKMSDQGLFLHSGEQFTKTNVQDDFFRSANEKQTSFDAIAYNERGISPIAYQEEPKLPTNETEEQSRCSSNKKSHSFDLQTEHSMTCNRPTDFVIDYDSSYKQNCTLHRSADRVLFNNSQGEVNAVAKYDPMKASSLSEVPMDRQESANNIAKMKEFQAKLEEETKKNVKLLEELSFIQGEKAKKEEELGIVKQFNAELKDRLSNSKEGVDDTELISLKTAIDDFKSKRKNDTIAERRAYDELKCKYTELQLLYERKKVELERTEGCLRDHSKIYENLGVENDKLRHSFNKKEEETLLEKNELLSSINIHKKTIQNLEFQIVSLRESKNSHSSGVPIDGELGDLREDQRKRSLDETANGNLSYNIMRRDSSSKSQSMKDFQLKSYSNGVSGNGELQISREDRLSKQLNETANGNLPCHVDNPADSCDVLTIRSHHNILDINLRKVVFDFDIHNQFRSFLAWVVPFETQDPLQYTNYAIGNPALFGQSCLYKFRMSFRNCLIFKNEVLRVNVYTLLPNNHPFKIGYFSISLREMIDHPQNVLHGTAELHSDFDELDSSEQDENLNDSLRSMLTKIEKDDTVGTLFYSVCLLKPAAEYFAKFKRKYSEYVNSIKKKELNLKNVEKESRTILNQSSSTTSSKSDQTEIANELRKMQEKIGKSHLGSYSDASQLNRPIQIRDERLVSNEVKIKSLSNSDSSPSTIKRTSVIKKGNKHSDRTSSDTNRDEGNSKLRKFKGKLDIEGESSDQDLAGHYSSGKILKKDSHHSEELDRDRLKKSSYFETSSGNDENSEIDSDSESSKGVHEVSNEATDEESSLHDVLEDKPQPKTFAEKLRNVFRKRVKVPLSRSKSHENDSKIVEANASKLKRNGSQDIPTNCLSPASDKTKALAKQRSFTNENNGKRTSKDKSNGKRRLKTQLMEDDDTKNNDKREKRAAHDNNSSENLENGDKKTSKIEKGGKTIVIKKGNKETVKSGMTENWDDNSSNPTDSQVDDTESSLSESHTSLDEEISSVILGGFTTDALKNANEGEETYENHSASPSQVADKSDDSELVSNYSSTEESSSRIVNTQDQNRDNHNSSELSLSNGVLRIEIISIEFDEGASVTEDPSIELIFVDYSGFLGLPPENVETLDAQTKLPPGERILFNFVNDIEINKFSEKKRFKILQEMLNKNQSIRFNVAAEPPSQYPEMDCREIGYATLMVNSLVKGFEGGIAIQDIEQETVGTLFIKSTFRKQITK